MRAFRILVVLCFILTAAALPLAAQSATDISFIHASDVHAPRSDSAATIAGFANLGEVELTPFGVKAPAPSFVVMSGDATEFGGGAGAWDAYMSYWKDYKIPVYTIGGNHDGAWYSIRPFLRKLNGGKCSWSIDKSGCHIIGLDNSTPQELRANVTEEQLIWMKEDLKKVTPETPVFLVLHHPINETLWSSPYATSRILDVLRPYNFVGILMGHGHSASNANWYGVDNIQGGSTWGPGDPGVNIVTIKDHVLYSAYLVHGQTAASKAIITKPIPPKSTYPKIEILSPSENGIRRTGKMVLRAKISGSEKTIVKGEWLLDGTTFQKSSGKEAYDNANPMVLRDGVYEADAAYTEWVAGVHYIRFIFTDSDGAVFTKCVQFGTEPEPSRLIWRTFVGGSCKGPATMAGGTVYVGATDTKLYALDKVTGKVKWAFPTEGDVVTKPLVVGDMVYFGSGDGKFYAVSAGGKKKWEFTAGEGIYNSPAYSDGLILFGCSNSNFYALDAKTGEKKWVYEDPAYTIDADSLVDNGIVFFGAWDENAYALDVKTGQLKWKCQTHGPEVEKAKRYYSPADCGPVASSGKVFFADRGYFLTVIDIATGSKVRFDPDCVGVGISEDGKAIYEREPGYPTGTFVGLRKTDLDGNEIWKINIDVDTVPTAPVEKDGIVYVVSKLGLVQAFKAADGSALWEYQATPLLYVLSKVEVSDSVVYVTGMDGSVTALKSK